MARLTSSNNVMSGWLDEQNLLSRRLASTIEEHTAHITNLMKFEKAWRQQMDDHWKRLEEIEEMVKRTAATIHSTNDAIAETARQNERLVAQLTGVRANAETAATTARSDITDLRARLIPELRKASASLLNEATSLQATLSMLNSKNTIGINPPGPPTPSTGNTAPIPLTGDTVDNKTHDTPPPPRASGVSIPPTDASPCFNSSWYHNARHPCFNNPATTGTTFNATNQALGIQHPDRLHVDTPTYAHEPPFMGGQIMSPRSTDKERQARLLKLSCHDVAGLACNEYHSGPAGINELTLKFIHACGYQTFPMEDADDVLSCYSHIQLLHKKVRQAWFNPPTLQSGPSVDRILEKGLTVLPKLRETSAKETVAFYECLQQVSAAYLIPLMPFDAICIKNNYEGLFPPGLGTETYAECSAAILEILPRLLPITNTEILATVSSVSNASRNGYDLLWRILELSVPGFDPTVLISQPQWTRDSTILDFCQGHLLYFCLQAKKGVFFTSRDRTNIFLQAVASSEYADVVTTIQTSVDTYCHPDDDGHLPDQFRLSEIAMLVHNNAKHRLREFHTPWIHRTSAPDETWADGYRTSAPDETWADGYNSDDPPYLVQGYCPQIHRMEQKGDRSPAGRVARFGSRTGDRQDRPPTQESFQG
jgi:hypothetical protein